MRIYKPRAFSCNEQSTTNIHAVSRHVESCIRVTVDCTNEQKVALKSFILLFIR